MQISDTSSKPEDLRAEDIRFSFQSLEGRNLPKTLQAERSVLWTSPGRSPSDPGRALSASALTMTYSEKGEYLQSGTATGKVTMTVAPRPGNSQPTLRQLLCDRAIFRFAPEDSRLQEMSGDGNVHLLYQKPGDPSKRVAAEEFKSASDRIQARFRDSDGTPETIVQSGNFEFQDGTRTARSGNCEYSEATQVMVLLDHPSIEDPDTTTSGERIEYNRKENVMIVRRNVRSILRKAQSKGLLSSSGGSTSSPGIVMADEMQYWPDQSKARYVGEVHLLSSENQLQAQSLIVSNGGERIEAEGSVRHDIQKMGAVMGASAARPNPATVSNPSAQAKSGTPVRIRSSKLIYVTAGNSLQYSGKVSLESGNNRLESDFLDITLDSEGNRVNRAHARSKVILTSRGLLDGRIARELLGEDADYNVQENIMVITGNDAEFRDFAKPEKPSSTKAPRLTFFISDDRISAGPKLLR
jgi:lipopolysaccharide export system protein LptA